MPIAPFVFLEKGRDWREIGPRLLQPNLEKGHEYIIRADRTHSDARTNERERGAHHLASERGRGFHFQEGPKTIAAADRKDKRTRRSNARRSERTV